MIPTTTELAVWCACLLALLPLVWLMRWVERRTREHDLAAARRVDVAAAKFVDAQRAALADDVAAGRLTAEHARVLGVLLDRLAEPTEAVVRRIYA